MTRRFKRFMCGLWGYVACLLLPFSLPAAVSITGGDFEADSGQDVADWFDFSSGNGDLHQDENGNPSAIPQDSDGSYWLNLVDSSSFTQATGVYQQIGTHDAGVTRYDVTMEVGMRSDAPFNRAELQLYSGSATGADGTPPSSLGGLTLVDSVLLSQPAGNAPVSASVTVSLDAASVPTGETLWLALASTDDASSGAQQGLFDDISILAFSPTVYEASHYYIDPSGDDGHDGSESAPFATLARGVEEAGPNVTLHVAPGTYAEAITIPSGGTALQPFTIEAQVPGTVVVAATSPALLQSAVDASGYLAENVTVRGIVFRDAGAQTNKAALMPVAGWSVEQCRIEDCGAAIRIDGGLGRVSGIRISDTVIEDCPSGGITGVGDPVSGASGPTGIEIRNSVVRRCHSAGNRQGSEAAGIFLSRAVGAKIQGCVIYDNAGPGLWLADQSDGYTISGNTIFAQHGREWWSGAGIQIEYCGGVSTISDNLLYSNTGPGVALCESNSVSVSGNTMIDNGTCITFRNIYIWNTGTTGFSIANDNKLRDISISGNQFARWRRAAINSWDRSLIRLSDLESREVVIAGNTYDPSDAGDVYFSLLDDLVGDPSELPAVVFASLDDLQGGTGFGLGASDSVVTLPKGTQLFESTHTGLDPQVNGVAETISQRAILGTASVGDTVVLPFQRASLLVDEAGTYIGSLFDLTDHVALRIEAPNATVANALNASLVETAMTAPAFIKAQVSGLTPYDTVILYDSSAGHSIRDNLVTPVLQVATASEDGPTSGVVDFQRQGVGVLPLTLDWSLEGDAVPGVDYVDPGTTLELAGETTELLLTAITNDAVDGDREAVLVLHDGSGYFAGSPSSAMVTIVDRAFEVWRGDAFNYTGSAPVGAGPLDNPDGDAYSNLEEFALCGNPTEVDTNLVRIGQSPSGHLTIEYDSPSDTGGVTITPQLSETLLVGSWSTDAVEILGTIDMGASLRVTAQDVDPIVAHERRFLRVSIAE
ncbi:right-handed parallel beta-helix repeat-containing protein [Coraliomargarita parva]|uniref:right-handed parallel beta-helix repeat-containing protein n=1 Tax=Coraliomargarita parva TaxID=3014050 RepID=UPI0022B3FE0A|nr:right-handed parallel beta-helix repeat-containing protein [Coraliomargarita parva]